MLLREIAREPGVSVSGLGRKTGLSKGYVSAVVDQMGGEGLVEKQPDTEDQRCVQIGLTNEGTELLSRLDLSYRGFWAELLLGVSDCDGARIVEGLECLRVALGPRGAPSHRAVLDQTSAPQPAQQPAQQPSPTAGQGLRQHDIDIQ